MTHRHEIKEEDIQWQPVKERHLTLDDVIYFAVTDRFVPSRNNTEPHKMHGGTLAGIISKLPYLHKLGVTAIWITPVYQNIKEFFGTEPYHYYWAQDFTNIDKRLLDQNKFKTPQKSTFHAFVDECESKGFKVILDMVVNHAGYGAEHTPPFNDAWFHPPGSRTTIEMWLAGLPDFDHDKPDVLEYFINNISDWIKQGGVTNIRMDTAKHVEPKFWHYFKSQIRGQYPNTKIIGEVLCEGKDEIYKLQEYQNYHDFDAIFDFPLCTALHQTLIYDGDLSFWLARPRLSDFEPYGVLDHDNPDKGGYRNPNGLVTLLDNHDLKQRIMSHARAKHSGNGAGLDLAIKVNKLCLGALFTMRGIPQLYYGTEIGLEGWKSEQGDDADLRRDFPWDAVDVDLEPKDGYHKEREIYEWTRALISMRKKNEAFRYGTTITLWSDNFVYAFLRISLNDVAFVIINNGYLPMPSPIKIYLNPASIPHTVIQKIQTAGNLKHWISKQNLPINSIGQIELTVDGKSIEIYC